MEDKEKEISKKENNIDSINEIEKIDELKEFIMGEYKEALLRTIEVDNLEKLRETIKNLDTKYEKDVKGLREKFDLIIELGEKISTIDTKYSNSIENLKNNEIKNLDTKYLDVLGKFNDLKDKIIKDKDEIIRKLEEKLAEKERELENKSKELEENKASILNLKQKLEQEKVNNEREVSILNGQLREKEAGLERKTSELEEKTAFIQKLTQKLEEEKANNQREVNTLNEQLREKKAELVIKNDQLTFLGEEIRNQKVELKDKEYKISILEEKTENEKTENEKVTTGLKIALNNFYEKIEKPYENLLKAIEESKVAESIGNYLGFNNEKGLSKSMILFALASDDNLARKVAMFYLERKEILEKEDFRIIEEVNNIYTNKPWGILYAEPEGVYQSSLVKDRKSSSIYRNFTAMYSPAYRPDETGNSPIKGIVDGK
jgi:viral A-type inclusion protein, putative